MTVDYDTAERAATYYCEVTALEEEGATEDTIDSFTDDFGLTPEEDKVLSLALEAGLAGYFTAEDIIECVS